MAQPAHRESIDYAATFGHAAGARVLQDIQDGFWYRSALYEPGMDPQHLAFREGQRSVAVWLTGVVEEALNDMDAVPETSTEDVEPEEGSQQRFSL